jgi:hypothetical protein
MSAMTSMFVSIPQFEICSTCIITYLYILINMIDTAIVGFLLSSATSIHKNAIVKLLPFELGWLFWYCLMISFVISFEVLLGFSAISFPSCRCASVLPFNIHFVISCISATSGAIAFILEPFVFNHINNRMNALGLSQEEITNLKSIYVVNAIIFLVIIPLSQAFRSYIR